MREFGKWDGVRKVRELPILIIFLSFSMLPVIK